MEDTTQLKQRIKEIMVENLMLQVAAAVKFLASPEAGYITGSVLKVDGGIF